MAATGLLGINPYQKGVALDFSSKPINLGIQLEQREAAKREAVDKYFKDYEKSLNPAGMRTIDQDAFLKKLAETKQYYLKNRDQILNPAKYGAEAQSQLMSGYKDILSTIDKSKQRAADDRVLAPLVIDANKNNRTIPSGVLDALERNKLSIADPNHIDFDPLSFDAYDKHDPFKYQQGIYSRIKPSESIPQPIFDKQNNTVVYKTINDISNKSFGEIQNVVASELQKDRGLIDNAKEIAKDPNKLYQLAQVYKDFSGKQMNQNSLLDVATAYTIALKPEAQVKYTNPTTTEDFKLENNKKLARYRKDLGLDGAPNVGNQGNELDNIEDVEFKSGGGIKNGIALDASGNAYSGNVAIPKDNVSGLLFDLIKEKPRDLVVTYKDGVAVKIVHPKGGAFSRDAINNYQLKWNTEPKKGAQPQFGKKQITVVLDGKEGTISEDQWGAFNKKYPNAKRK